ncbi:MAG: carboxyl transferase domain-containing protein [Gemmataceae bacterium]
MRHAADDGRRRALPRGASGTVKAAIGQVVDSESLGGAKMHASISGTIDYREPNDDACIERLRRLVGALPADKTPPVATGGLGGDFTPFTTPEYDVRHLLKLILDDAPFDEYKADYGQTLVCGFGKLGGTSVGIVANQKQRVKPAEGPLQFGGVIYVDSADKAARFVMDCNQLRVPILFIQNVNGFMVGGNRSNTASSRPGRSW